MLASNDRTCQMILPTRSLLVLGSSGKDLPINPCFSMIETNESKTGENALRHTLVKIFIMNSLKYALLYSGRRKKGAIKKLDKTIQEKNCRITN